MSKASKDDSKTIIYRIPVGDDNYYGHTTQPLHKRKYGHKSRLKTGNTSKVYKRMRELQMTPNDIELFWVEDYPCESEYQAQARERFWIENYATLNHIIPTRTPNERHKEKYNTDENYKQNILEKNRKRWNIKYADKDFQTNESKRKKETYEAHKEDIQQKVNERYASDPKYKAKKDAFNHNYLHTCIVCDVCGEQMKRFKWYKHRKTCVNQPCDVDGCK